MCRHPRRCVPPSPGLYFFHQESPVAGWVSGTGVGISETLSPAVLQVLMKNVLPGRKNTPNFKYQYFCCLQNFLSCFRSYALQQPVCILQAVLLILTYKVLSWYCCYCVPVPGMRCVATSYAASYSSGSSMIRAETEDDTEEHPQQSFRHYCYSYTW